jgi:hypothetical protein
MFAGAFVLSDYASLGQHGLKYTGQFRKHTVKLSGRFRIQPLYVVRKNKET